MALAKSMPPVEKVADRNKSDAAYRAGSPTIVTREQRDVSMAPTFYGTYVAEED
jgi:hypothetical protein